MYIGRRAPSRTGGGVFPGRNSHRKRCRPLGALFREKAYAQDAIRAVSRRCLCRTGIDMGQVGPPGEVPRAPQEVPAGRAGRELPKRPVRGSSARGCRARARANSGLAEGRAACSRKPPKSEERRRGPTPPEGGLRDQAFPRWAGRARPLPSFPNSNDFSPRKRVTHVEPPSAEAGPARRAQRTPALREVPSHLTDEASCGADGTSRGNPAYANPGLTETGRFRGEF